MKISSAVEKAINEQINKELFSAYLYWSMAAWFEEQNLKGFGTWMRVQEGEERVHATKLFDFLIERGGTVKLASIEAPKLAWKSPLDAFEEAYEHEQFITKSIHDLRTLAEKEKDSATEVMLNWFVSEQVEEEANTSEIVGQLKLVKDMPPALMMLDHRLGKRKGEED